MNSELLESLYPESEISHIQREAFLAGYNTAMEEHFDGPMERKMIMCPSCLGDGYWEAECCNGSGGCSCGGQPVNMGRCNVCGGSGQVEEGNYNPRANVNFIERGGYGYLGTGPSYNTRIPALGRR